MAHYAEIGEPDEVPRDNTYEAEPGDPPAPPLPTVDELIGPAAALRAMGNPPRLRLLLAMAGEPRTIRELSEVSGASQPVVSVRLRELRAAGLAAECGRTGVAVAYGVTAKGRRLAVVAGELVDEGKEAGR